MRDFLKSMGPWLRTGSVAVLVMFVGPACLLDSSGFGDPDKPTCEVEPCKPHHPDDKPPVKFPPSDGPPTSAIMCEIPQPVVEGMDDMCATDEEAAAGLSLAAAGTALASSQSASYALDWSLEATSKCDGRPEKKFFFGKFPEGFTVCLNCGEQIPSVFADKTAACVAKCEELLNFGDGPIPDEGVDAFCLKNAKTAINYDKDICYEGGCTDGGMPTLDYKDPRRESELVKWVDLIGVTDNGGSNSLTRTLPTTGTDQDDFQAGAASAQLIARGDAWVEFEASEVNLTHVLGVRATCADVYSSCPDTLPSLVEIGFALDLASDGGVYVLESSPAVTVHGPFGTYSAGERYRVRVFDNNDGKATISYSRVIGECIAGTVCQEEVLYTSVGGPVYPLRVDSSFREQGATLANVTLVRIKQ